MLDNNTAPRSHLVLGVLQALLSVPQALLGLSTSGLSGLPRRIRQLAAAFLRICLRRAPLIACRTLQVGWCVTSLNVMRVRDSKAAAGSECPQFTRQVMRSPDCSKSTKTLQVRSYYRNLPRGIYLGS